jgi:hypothetical protein
MAIPARENAPARDPGGTVHRPDLTAPGWADVRTAAVATILAAGQAVSMLADSPGSDSARKLAGFVLAAIESQSELIRRAVLDDAVLSRAEKRAFEQGFAAGQALRGRLSLVSSG